MPFVNYVKEHTAFIEYAADNGLRTNEILVWEALFHIMNQRSNGNYWPDGFIRVKNDRLLTYAPIGFDSLARARNALAQRGLIAYKPGKRNTDIPMYELHYLTAAANPQLHDDPVDNAVDNPCYTSCYPQKTDNIGGNMGDNIKGNMRDNMGGRMSHQYININKTERNQNETCFDDDDEEEGRATRARTCGDADGASEDDDQFFSMVEECTQAAERAIKTYFGKSATPIEAAEIGRHAAIRELPPELVDRAVRVAAFRGATTPAAYVIEIFKEWGYEQVRTDEEACEYQLDRDAENGKGFFIGDSLDIYKHMEKKREERRKKHEAAKGG